MVGVFGPRPSVGRGDRGLNWIGIALCTLLLLLPLVHGSTPIPIEGKLCEQCNCVNFPKTLVGTVVDVQRTDGVWLPFTSTVTTKNLTTAVIFRSTTEACTVEIKFRSVNTTAPLLVYPYGRQNTNMLTLNVLPIYPYCYFYEGDLSNTRPILGKSLVSIGPEAAVVLLGNPLRDDSSVFNLLYRQKCDSARVFSGIEVPVATQTVQTAQLVAPPWRNLNGNTADVFVRAPRFRWSLRVPNAQTHALEVRVTQSTAPLQYSINGSPMILGVTYLIPLIDDEAVVEVSNGVIGGSMTLQYRAVAVLEPLTGITIVSWNTVAKPLPFFPPDVESRIINFTFPFAQAQQAAVWYFDRTKIPADVQPRFVIMDRASDGGFPWPLQTPNELWTFIPDASEKTAPLTTFTQSGLKGGITFQYWYTRNQPKRIEVNTTLPTWENLTVNRLSTLSPTIEFVASDPKCMVALQFPVIFTNRGSGIRLFPLGLGALHTNSDLHRLNHIRVDSAGPKFGVKLLNERIPFNTDYLIQYAMVCPNYTLPVDFPNVDERLKWRHAKLNENRSIAIVPHPERADCAVEFAFTSIENAHNLAEGFPQITCPDLNLTNIIDQNNRPVIIECPGNLIVQVRPFDIYSTSFNPRRTTFAYRVRCPNEVPVGDDVAPLLDVGTVLDATNQWKEGAAQEYEYEDDYQYQTYWTIKARDPKCRIELLFPAVDFTDLKVFEEFSSILDGELVNTPTSELDNFPIPSRKLRYLSCNNRVFLAAERWSDTVQRITKKLRYRQVCPKVDVRKQRCVKEHVITPLPSQLGKWKTFRVDYDGSNWNQMLEQQYTIEYDDFASQNDTQTKHLVLEVEFTSVVTQTWMGYTYGRNSDYSEATTNGVRINKDAKEVIAGKQYFFRESVTLSVESQMKLKKGDHLFTVQYRMVDWNQAKRERDLGQVLVATNKDKTLKFKIPQQFSIGAGQKKLKAGILVPGDDDYGTQPGLPFDSATFNVWSFKHHYTIQPANPKCRVVLRFTKMDIGSGYIAGPKRVFRQEQHRLAVLTDASSNIAWASKSCASELWKKRSTTNMTKAICARLDHRYVSEPKNNSTSSSLVVFFRSIQAPEEYEENYEYDSGYGEQTEIISNSGTETTWGTGWTAVYRQDCSIATDVPVAPAPKLVVATPQWKTTLPQFPDQKKVKLFMDKRWTIVPKNPDTCSVQFQVTGPKINTNSQLPYIVNGRSDSKPVAISERNVTFILAGISPRFKFSLKYRQLCTAVPTASPTIFRSASPTIVPPPLREVGETCTTSLLCQSGICSAKQQRCTAATCASQCKAKQAVTPCESFAIVGCSCFWSGKCLENP